MNQFLKPPSTDFSGVRDGRLSMPLHVDIDLSIARSKEAGTALTLPIAGNSLFCDQNPLRGAVTITFQDSGFDQSAAEIYAAPGFIGRVPFTQIVIENSAQIGRIARIFYGVDLDFTPGSNTQVAISGQVSILEMPTSSVVGSIADGVTNVKELIAPGANINGIKVLSARIDGYHPVANLPATALLGSSLLAAPSLPTLYGAGVMHLSRTDSRIISGTNLYTGDSLSAQFIVPAGYGIYFGHSCASTAATRVMANVSYIVL